MYDPHISADEDNQAVSPEADQVSALPESSRVYSVPNRKGETEKSAWVSAANARTAGRS
jgi:hypothetical protein